MRKSAVVKLTLVPMLAASALAYAQAPGQTDPVSQAPIGESQPAETWVDAVPVPNAVPIPLMPPGMTPTIDELTCDEDPNWQLRNDCQQVEVDGETMVVGTGVVRGGYGGYFWTGGG